MISHSLRLAVAVAVVVTVASRATGRDPTPSQALIAPESMTYGAEKPSAKADGELLRLEQQLAVKERRLVLEEKQMQLQQRQRALEEMKRKLNPKRLRARHEQSQKMAAQQQQVVASSRGPKREREQQAKAEPVIKIFRLLRDKASDQVDIVELIAPKLRAIAHVRTNTIIVFGPKPQVDKVEALLKKLDEMETVTVDPQVQLPTPLSSDLMELPTQPPAEIQPPRPQPSEAAHGHLDTKPQ
jgi:type II secretory pathway component GspD/PulD (secretin)